MPMSSENTGSGQEQCTQAHLVVAIHDYQTTVQLAQATTDEVQKKRLQEQANRDVLIIWAALEPFLLQYEVWRWRYSRQMDSILAGLLADETYTDALRSLALSMFCLLLPELSKCKIDPERNVRAYLLTIIHRQMQKMEARIYSNRPRKNVNLMPLPSPQHDGETVQGNNDIPDEWYADSATSIITRLERKDCVRAVMTFWQANLHDLDFMIIKARWLMHPPRSFAEIAAQLGAGYTEDAVRQRHQRIMKKTRLFLQEQGWDGDECL